MSVLETMKKKDLRKEYDTFLGEDKTAYYLKKFDKLESKNSRISINFAALFFSTYWCFYRKLFLPGAIFLIMNFSGLYLSLLSDQSWLGNVLVVLPSIACGLFGNYFYFKYTQKCVIAGQDMGYEEKAKYYANNGGTSTRIVLGIVAAFLFFGLALLFSAGPQAAEKLQGSPLMQNMPQK